MRLQVFLSGAVVIALGVVSLQWLGREDGVGFLQGALTLGGAFLICGFFMGSSMKWHGMVGAGIVALLAAGRGLRNIPGLMKFIEGDRPRGVAPVLELAVMLICVFLLIKVLRTLFSERTRKMLEEESELRGPEER